ncbi:cupin-like domain-containing protein [Phenylobacterium deserti]|uniref:Cupin-like domain-containing protein n=1 Tax=Phenylobacterium deserti TaxID=1914756 RepID=A0A328ABR0_9CAUL|nr:cupin-like domain-containing protein [Phenylobacterium deserti]RAK52172.1 cupin-like domain-containing protein [Phenylobacterium deserti]
MPVRELSVETVAEPDVFRREVAELCQPVVLRGACAGWPAAAAARQGPEALFAYLRQFDGGASAQAFVGEAAITGRYFYGANADGFNFRREQLGLSEALNRIARNAAPASPETLYLGSIPADAHLPGFSAANRAPSIPPGVEPRIWVGNASHVACHYDTFDNLACVVAGQRRFTLYPPQAVADLYVGPIDHTMAGQPVSLAAAAEPGDPRYPRFEAVRDQAEVVVLEAGDALYLPKLWWHQVEATQPVNLLVNYWWDGFSAGPDAPYLAMMLAMIAIGERPAPERDAWRAFFDHYVFRPDRHPAEHLPEGQRGVLGPLAAGNYGRLRAMIMRALRL